MPAFTTLTQQVRTVWRRHLHDAAMVDVDLAQDEVADGGGDLVPKVLLPVLRPQPHRACTQAHSGQLTYI